MIKGQFWRPSKPTLDNIYSVVDSPGSLAIHPRNKLIFKMNLVCETAKETQMYRTVFWTRWERARAGWYGRMALKYVNYHMWSELPVQVLCMIQGAWSWCTGMTQRDGMGGRWEGGGWGTHVHPWQIHVNVWQNHYNIVISLQLK